ncbi:helix-turn-helix domain-containing protein [Actinomadura rugatobispora]|uniref:Helix-turn-helix domain-containing protein n=1 Tax=Actinomadura rugatobispora TaxID=1994 RepID=A0ABW1A7Q2_9ACTN|nr:helix-turn-helix transcriptional regulator [Actinomadura rugatobispora]
MAPAGRTIRSKWLGDALLRARKNADLTGDEVAQQLGWPASKVSRIENGLIRAHWGDVQDLLDLYGVTDADERTTLIKLAKSLRERGWWRAYGGELSHPFADLLSLEGTADEIDVYQPQLLPGLLQTRAYAMAVIGASRMQQSKEEVERFVEIRTARQDILTRATPVHLWAIVGEAALRQQIGGIAVMQGQLRHLLEISELPNVTVQVLPFTADATTGMYSPFSILTFAGTGLPEVVHIENLTGGIYLELPEEVGHYRSSYNHLRASALPTGRSARLIAAVSKEI